MTLRPPAFCAVAIAIALLPQWVSAQSVRASRIAADRWRVVVENAPPRLMTREEERGSWSRVEMPGYIGRIHPGAPELPFRRLPFAVPPGGRLEFTLHSVKVERLAARLAAYGSAIDAARAGRDDFADDFARAGAPMRRNGLDIRSVEFVPARYDAGAGILTWIREAVIDIRIIGAPARSEPAGAGTGETAGLADGRTILNAADAERWRATERMHGPAPARFTGPFVRIRVRERGVYRITQEELAAAGVPVQAIDPRVFRLEHRGTEQPIFVSGEADGRFDPGDFIEFVGSRKAGERGDYFDLWSDDNVSFLRWDGANGLRCAVEDATPGPQSPEQWFPARLHLEENRVYHLGDSDAFDTNDSEYTFGEGWIWSYLLKKDSLTIPFAVPDIAPGAASVSIRVKGSSKDPSRMRVSVNGDSLAVFDIGNVEMTTKTVSIPGGLLRRGANSIVIKNLGIIPCPDNNPTCSIERFYVDWLEVTYPNTLRAERNEYLFDGSLVDSVQAPPLQRYAVGGFTGGLVTGYNLRTFARLTGIQAAADTGGTRATMTLQGAGSYLMASETALRRVDSLELRTARDLAAAGAGAEYLVITHADFLPAAQRLADYRRTADGFQTLVVDVEEAYDAYGSGMRHPRAIREFIRALRAQSGETLPRFVVLLGDASWDPNRYMPNSSKTDFLPTYGNPADDNYFVSFGDAPGDIVPSVSIGRIPAETLADAQAVIDKIVEYEALPPQEWHNRILFAIGGKTVFEQQALSAPIYELISTWMRPFCLEDRLIIKKNLDYVSYDDLDTIITEMNSGTLWFYFSGHGGTRIIDVGVERPDVFTLEGRYPFFVTMSCNTAHFAEPFETGLNERFAMAARNGAIVSYGTSGIGEVSRDAVLSDGMMKGMLEQGLRTYGEIALYGKLRLLDYTGLGDFYTRNTVNQYVILGDPATRIPLATTAELSVSATEIVTDPDIVAERRRTVITTRIRNEGLCLTDTVLVVLHVEFGGGTVHREERRVPPFLRVADLDWEYDFTDIVGSARIVIEVDPDGRVAEKTKANNTAAVERNVLPRGIALLFPLDCAAPAQGPLSFTVANPSVVAPDAEGPRIEMQISADADFLTVVHDASAPAGSVFTWFDWTPGTGADSVFYWRARYGTASGWEQWSAARSFTLTADTAADESWRETERGQLAGMALVGMDLTAPGTLRLGMRPLQLGIVSAGNNQSEFQSVELRIDGTDVAPDTRGFNVAVIEPVKGALVDTLVFDTYRGTAVADQMAAWLRAVPDDRIVMVAVRDDAAGYHLPESPVQTNVTPALSAELRRLGATLSDSIRYRDSYAFIGTRSAPGRAKEMHTRYGGVFFSDTFAVRALTGSALSPRIGPAGVWKSLRWSGTATSPDSCVDIRVHGSGMDGDTVLATFERVPPGADVALDAIPAGRFPTVRLELVLSDTSGVSGPDIDGWRLEYVSRFPEIGINSQVVRHDPDSLIEGAEVTVTADIFNAGRADARDLRVRCSLPAAPGGAFVEKDVPLIPAGRGTSARVEFALPTAGVRGTTRYDVVLDPAGAVTEYYAANNAYSGRFLSTRDPERPTLEVLFDGVEIADGDFVSPRADISVSMRDNSLLPVTDTLSVQMFFDGRRVIYGNNPSVTAQFGLSGEEKALIAFRPGPLSAGYHTLAVSGKDASGNTADTIPYQVTFRVSTDDKVDNVYPIPNPTRGAADFTFRVLGSTVPEEGSIKIYTVAGRLIRHLAIPPDDLRIGFNRVRWDGRDADGGDLANGVYFYKLVLTRGGKSVEIIDKLAVLR